MRAVILNQPTEFGENMVVGDVPPANPGTGEVQVSVAYAGCNFADLMMRKGIYPHPKGYPLIGGIEMSGTISAVGSDVVDMAVGDRVAAFCEDAGGFAEYCLVPARRVVKIPDTIGLDIAAAFCVQGLTAWHLLHSVSRTKPGDEILVHAIGGGVGLYLTQLAVLAGATVLGTVGTPGKEHRALEFGATRVINRQQEDFVEAVMEATNGRGVDKIIDSTGGSILDRSFNAIRRLGHVVSYGEAEGQPYANLWDQLVSKSLTFTRLHIGHIDCGSDAWRTGTDTVMSMISDGSVRVPIEGVFALEDVHKMFQALESRTIAGKLLLKIE